MLPSDTLWNVNRSHEIPNLNKAAEKKMHGVENEPSRAVNMESAHEGVRNAGVGSEASGRDGDKT